MRTNQSELELEFKIGHCNGTMAMEIFVDNIPVASYSSFTTDRFVFKHRINWPTTLRIVLSNKNPMHDTTVDTNGNITADKYIQLTKILVDRIETTVGHINSVVLNTDENKITTLYWGFNGSVELKLDQADSFVWHLAQRTDHSKTYVVCTTRF
jgi:hypothetical protein